MKAIACIGAGGPEVLRVVDRDVPVPGPTDILIKVHASGLNHADLAQRAGFYPLPTGVTDILGLEVAGEVAYLGSEVAGRSVGDRVCALLVGGGHAEYVSVPAVQVLRVPDGLNFTQAAALPEAFATVWMNVFQKAALQPHEHLLVHGGSSGVGTAAIQLAHALGAHVVTTAGTDEKCRSCVLHGAQRAINYRTEDFAEVLLEGERKQFMDVVFDMIGGSYFERNVQVLARGGRMVYVSALAGRKVELDLVDLMRKRLALFGSVLRPLAPAEKGAILSDMARVVWPLLERGAFSPVVFDTYAYEDVASAHRVMDAHTHTGKLVLTW
ncbi:NAD(P)H-quinone oxidoreductase [Variovorax sp. Root411]|uniref:NAD(P)H-quinone oxidoreductase n=1 Tax=Variovorax sp. Root411 TaxID=1736530 RepID=UPI0006F9D738|nr:NAD(P)H-quinone oxidoreductase [Variovorax sp. Root411]KQW64907.1 hypothetical protein ASC92_05615 [Variovorax sp. Root411]